MCHLQGLVIPLLLIAAPQIVVQARILLAHLARRFFRLLLEIRLSAVEVVESASDLPRQLQVRHLILPHRHLSGLVDQDIGRLQDRVAKEAEG